MTSCGGRRRGWLVCAVAALTACLALLGAARQAQAGQAPYQGPPPPVAPEVITRDADGRATIRAVRVATPIEIDGRLDEAVYAATLPMSDYFIQIDPTPGAASTEKTEVWLFFDDDNLYVTCRCWESHPERMVVNELRRDSVAITQNEYFAFEFDPFYDRRNGIFFTASAIGGRIDGQSANEQTISTDFNPIWDSAPGRFDGGWVIEAAIPFKSMVQPFYVLIAVPFGVIGALLGHIIMGITPSYLSIFGMLALAGVVVNDSLVLVDFVNRQVRDGTPLKEAVLSAGARRFRPILLTSVTTFVGLMPLLMDRSIQAQFLIPMAVSLGFGVLFATAITLILVPCALLLGQDLGILISRAREWYFGPFRKTDSVLAE